MIYCRFFCVSSLPHKTMATSEVVGNLESTGMVPRDQTSNGQSNRWKPTIYVESQLITSDGQTNRWEIATYMAPPDETKKG